MNESSSNSRKHYYKAYRQKYKQLVKRVNCTLIRDEYEELSRQASKAGLKLTPYVKRAAFAYTKQEYVVPLRVEEDLQEIIWLLRSIGNNLNQLAAKANTLKQATIFDLKKAKKSVHELESIIKNFVRNPSKQRQSNDSEIFKQKNTEFQANT